MTSKLFARPIHKTLTIAEAREGELATYLTRAEKLLDGETLTSVHVVEGAVVIEGEAYAALLPFDGGATVASLAEAKGEDDEEPEDDGDDEEPEDDSDDEEDESVNEMAMSRPNYEAIANAIAHTGLPRKLKTMAAEALAARFEELPGSFNRGAFVRTAISGGDEGDEGGEASETTVNEAAMTKKHFAMIAQALAELDIPTNHKRDLVGSIATALGGQAERFNRDRFVKATGLAPSQASEGLEITYCEEGVQLVRDGEQVALVRCNTESHVESVRAIGAIEEYANSLGYVFEPAKLYETEMSEDELIEAEWDAIDDMRAQLTVAFESFTAEEIETHTPTLRAIDEAINEGDFELAEELAEPLLEYKRMGQSARRMRIRSLRMGIPQSVKSGKVTRSEHRRNLIKRRRTYRTSAGMRSKAKRYSKRYARFRARLRPVSSSRNESVDRMRPLADVQRDARAIERQMGLPAGSLREAVNMAHASRPGAQKRETGEGEAGLTTTDEARQTKEEKLLAAEVTKTYGKWFDRVQVPMLKLPAISNDIRALLASKADLNVEMPKLVAKYRAESVEEAGDKLGVLAGEVMTYLINRPRATAEDLTRRFRCTDTAAQAIMNIAAQALAQGDSNGTYHGHVKAIGDVLAKDSAFEHAEVSPTARPFARDLTEGRMDALLRQAKAGQLKGDKTWQSYGSNDFVAYVGRQGIAGASSEDELMAILKKAGLNPKDFKKVGGIAVIENRDVAKGHQTKIALSTLKMHALGARLMGGMNHAQAVRFLTTQANYSAEKVRGLLLKAGHSESDIDDMFHLADKADEAEKPEYGSKGFMDHSYECREVFKSFKDCDLPAGHKGPHKMKKPKADEARSDSDYSPNADALNELGEKLYNGAFDAAKKRASGRIQDALRGERASEALIRKAKAMGKLEGRIAEYVEQLAQEDAMGDKRTWDDVWSEVSMEFKDEPGFDFEEGIDEALQLPTNSTIVVKDPYARPVNHGEEMPTQEVPAYKLAKATIFMPGGYGWTKREVNDLVLWQAKYAQHEKALHVQYREKGKRKTVANAYGYKPRLIVFDGWGIDLDVEDPYGPETSTTPGVSTRKGKRLSQDPGWDDEMLARVNNYKGKAPVVSIVEGECAWTEIDEETGQPKFALGDLVTLGGNRTRKYLVLGLDRWGNPYAHALSGTEKGSQLSGAPPDKTAIAVVGKASDATFTGKMASKLRAKAEAQRQMVKRFEGATVWDGELPPVATDEDAGHGVCEGKQVPPIDSPVYTERVKWPKYNVKISPLSAHGSDGGKILARRLQGWTKADHLAAAAEHDKRAAELEADWAKTADAAAQATWGRKFQVTDYRISGIGSDEFTTEHKDRLRYAAHTKSAHKDAAYAHRAAAKMRSLAKDESDDPEFDALVDEGTYKPDPAMRKVLDAGAAAFHTRGSDRSQARLGKVQLKPTSTSSAPPEFTNPKNPQTKGKKGDEFAVNYGGKSIGTIRFDGSVWSSADAKGKRVSSHEGWSLRNAILQLLGNQLGDAWGSADEAKRTPEVGDRVKVKGGKTGVVVSQRMAAPDYSTPQSFSVKLDDVKRPGYVGSMYSADDVELIDEAEGKSVARWETKGKKHWYELFQDADGFTYKGDGAGGNLGRITLDAAMAHMQSKVDMSANDGINLVQVSGKKLETDVVKRGYTMLPAGDSPVKTLIDAGIKSIENNPQWKAGDNAVKGRVVSRMKTSINRKRKGPTQTLMLDLSMHGGGKFAVNIPAEKGNQGDWKYNPFQDDKGQFLPEHETDAADIFVEARDPLDDIPARPDMTKAAARGKRMEDALTNALFNGTKLGDGFKTYVTAARSMLSAAKLAARGADWALTCDAEALQRAFRTGGEIECSFQGSKADARDVARQMMSIMDAQAEGLDEKNVQCYLCGRTKPKYSGSDEEPYCRECDAKMEKLRDEQHARYERMRKQDFEEEEELVWYSERVPFEKLAVGDRYARAGNSTIYQKVSDTSYRLVRHNGELHGQKAREKAWVEFIKLPSDAKGNALNYTDKGRPNPKRESIDEGVELPDGRIFDIKTRRIIEPTDEAVRKKLDFGDYEAKARRMSVAQLTGALHDIEKTLKSADSMDRETGSDDGGYYRDQASVLRKELDRRRKGGKQDEAEDADGEVNLFTEAEYHALDEAKRKKMKGYWRTTAQGHRIFIEDGKVTKGNPEVTRYFRKDKGFAKGAQARADASGWGDERRALLRLARKERRQGAEVEEATPERRGRTSSGSSASS